MAKLNDSTSICLKIKDLLEKEAFEGKNRFCRAYCGGKKDPVLWKEVEDKMQMKYPWHYADYKRIIEWNSPAVNKNIDPEDDDSKNSLDFSSIDNARQLLWKEAPEVVEKIINTEMQSRIKDAFTLLQWKIDDLMPLVITAKETLVETAVYAIMSLKLQIEKDMKEWKPVNPGTVKLLYDMMKTELWEPNVIRKQISARASVNITLPLSEERVNAILQKAWNTSLWIEVAPEFQHLMDDHSNLQHLVKDTKNADRTGDKSIHEWVATETGGVSDTGTIQQGA